LRLRISSPPIIYFAKFNQSPRALSAKVRYDVLGCFALGTPSRNPDAAGNRHGAIERQDEVDAAPERSFIARSDSADQNFTSGGPLGAQHGVPNMLFNHRAPSHAGNNNGGVPFAASMKSNPDPRVRACDPFLGRMRIRSATLSPADFIIGLSMLTS
jgi:hypothetical protein